MAAYAIDHTLTGTTRVLNFVSDVHRDAWCDNHPAQPRHRGYAMSYIERNAMMQERPTEREQEAGIVWVWR